MKTKEYLAIYIPSLFMYAPKTGDNKTGWAKTCLKWISKTQKHIQFE